MHARILLCESAAPSQEDGSKVVKRAPSSLLYQPLYCTSLLYTIVPSSLYQLSLFSLSIVPLSCNPQLYLLYQPFYCTSPLWTVQWAPFPLYLQLCALYLVLKNYVRALGYDHNLSLLGTRNAATRGRKIIYARNIQ